MTEDWRKTDDMDDYAARWRRESDGIPQRRQGGMYWRMSYGGGAGDGDVAAWVAAVKAAGGTVSNDQASRVTDLLAALKGGGVWPLLDRLWLFAAEDSTQALTDIKSLAVATAVNSPTFTENRGYAGNGTTAYIDSNFNPSTAGGNYARNDALFGCWIETASSLTARVYMAPYISQYSFLSKASSSAYGWPVNQSATQTYNFVSEEGLWSLQRTGASATELFKDGASVATGTTGSTALENRNIFILIDQAGGSPVDGRLASAFAGKSLTTVQQSAFYTAMRAYMTAVGVA